MGKHYVRLASHVESGACADLEVDKIPHVAVGLEKERTEPGQEEQPGGCPFPHSQGASGQKSAFTASSLPGHSLLYFSLASVTIAPIKSAFAKLTSDFPVAKSSKQQLVFIFIDSLQPFL